MHIRIDAIKKKTKDLCLNRTKASAPITCAKLVFVPFAFGGVFGKLKLINPKTAEAMAAIINVIDNWSVDILNTLSIAWPIAIQPSVPKKRTDGNSLLGSFICRKATEFTN